MEKHEGLNFDAVAAFAPRGGERPLLPKLTAKSQLALMCHMLHAEGWNDHIAGHISWRQGDGTLLTNPWELRWDELRASDIVTIDPDGNHVSGEWNVTPALGLHIQIHHARKDAHVVVHNHPRWSGIWAGLRETPPVYDQAGGYCGLELPVYDEYAGTFEDGETSQSAVDALGDAKWALLANHGSLVVGKDLRQAHLRVVTLEWRARRAYEVRLAGGQQPMPDAAVEALTMVDDNGFPFLWEAMARKVLDEKPDIID